MLIFCGYYSIDSMSGIGSQTHKMASFIDLELKHQQIIF